MWAKNLGGKQKYLLINVYLWLCTIYRHKYLKNLPWKETPVVKEDPITTQQNTTLAEVDQDTVKPRV